MTTSFKPLQLYAAGTPNNHKVSIFCEELKAAYPSSFDFTTRTIDLSKGEQKEDWFIKINPNGRVPALVDPNRNDFPVFESAAILLYLEKHYDPEHKFSKPDAQQHDDFRSEVLQWMFFVHGGLGPMSGEGYVYSYMASESVPYAIKRYRDETRRLYDVLEIKLKGRDWLVGEDKGSYSMADMNAIPCVVSSSLIGIPRSDLPPSVEAWLKRGLAREPVVKGLLNSAMSEEMVKKLIETGEAPFPPKWKA